MALANANTAWTLPLIVLLRTLQAVERKLKSMPHKAFYKQLESWNNKKFYIPALTKNYK